MTSTTNATTVKSDLIHDLHYHVEKGNCFVVTLLQDYDWEPVGYGNISVDTYIIADTDDHARFIVSRLYPEATVTEVKRVNAQQYVARRSEG
jgi:hypothetical protein